MIKRICVYIAVCLLTLYCFFLYDDQILGMLLTVEVLYPILGAAALALSGAGVTARLGKVLAVAEKGQRIPVQVYVENRSRVLAVHFRIKMQIENTFTGERGKCDMRGCALRGGTAKVQTQIQSDDCGNLRIALEAVEIYDPLHIFFIVKRARVNGRRTFGPVKRKYGEVQRVGILPECHLLPVEVSRRTREFPADAEEYSDREKGDDPSEVYQLREYKERDALHDVHWKLSAKSEELLVKEHGKPLGPVVLIRLNLNRDFMKSKGRRTAKKQGWPSEILEAVVSLSLSLVEEKCVHMVAWYEEANRRVVKVKISKEIHVYELANRLLYALPYRGGAQADVENLPKDKQFGRVVEFRLDGAVLIGGEEYTRIPVDGRGVDWSGLYFTV